ncbi:MAG: alpha/beta hydrolase [Dehalococcoidia bacterium]|nr:alpha/beta hydrolase [Dehalococcoidia bacterium]
MPYAGSGDIKLYYEVIGQGDPLVLIMGYGHHSLHWGDLPQQIAKINYQVVVMDNRGVGRSDKPDMPMSIAMMADDVCSVMDVAGLTKASVFGVSMGGLIAQVFAFNHPDRLYNLVLGCTFPGGSHTAPTDPEGMRILFDYDYLGKMTPEQRSMTVFRFFCSEEFIETNKGAFDYYHRVTNEYPTPLHIFKRQSEAISMEDTWDRLPSIKAPTMVISGTDDRLVNFKNSELLAKRIPGAELTLLQDKRHGFFIEAVDSTRIFINGFMKRRSQR